jgi:hypothetical protein
MPALKAASTTRPPDPYISQRPAPEPQQRRAADLANHGADAKRRLRTVTAIQDVARDIADSVWDDDQLFVACGRVQIIQSGHSQGLVSVGLTRARTRPHLFTGCTGPHSIR